MTAMFHENTSRRGRVVAIERLKRLLSETDNLRRMLISYRYEPTTERFFNLRETLWERLNSLEGRCRQVLGKSSRESELAGLAGSKAQELYSEYNRLEGDTWKYLKEVRS